MKIQNIKIGQIYKHSDFPEFRYIGEYNGENKNLRIIKADENNSDFLAKEVIIPGSPADSMTPEQSEKWWGKFSEVTN